MEDLTGVKWIRSTYTSNNGGNCVEVAGLGNRRAVRDSKDREGPKLVFEDASWEAFVVGVTNGEFDLSG